MKKLMFAIAAVIAFAVTGMAGAGTAWAITGEINMVGGGTATGQTTITLKTDTGTKISTIKRKQTVGKLKIEIPKTTRRVDITITRNGETTTLIDIDVNLLTGPGGYTVNVPGGGMGQIPFQPMIPTGGMPGGGVPGPSMGFFGLCNSGTLGVTERLNTTGATTFQSSDSSTGCGGGVMVSSDGMFGAVTPFASLALMNQDIRHTFPAGTFIGEQIKWIGLFGVDVALIGSPNFQVYVTGGGALVNKEFTINFGGAGVSTKDDILFGGTLGVGGRWRPTGLRIGDRQIDVFAQYNHIWVPDSTMTSPAASPAFNYTFSNQIDIVTAGIKVPFAAGPSRPFTPRESVVWMNGGRN